MRFASPEWFLLLPILLIAGWFWPRLGLHRPVRILCLGLVTLLLVKPQIRHRSDGLDLWVLVDRSDSAKDLILPRLGEWEMLLEKSRGSNDRLHFVDYAAEALKRGGLLRAGSNATEFAGDSTETRTASAIGHALSQMEPERAARLLVLTDGYSTEPLEGLAERLVRQEVALDFRTASTAVAGDVRLAALTLPRRGLPREAFLIEIVAMGDVDGVVPVEITRNGQSLGRKDIALTRGVGRLRLTDRIGTPGAYQYQARLLPTQDSLPGNNVASQWVEIEGGPRILLVTNYSDDPLAKALAAQGFEVEVVQDSARLHIGQLNGVKAVLLNNVPAYKMPTDFLKALTFWVNEQGGGLAMIGGKHSFAAGGYYGSPVEPLLPVSMELKQEHRKLAVAVGIVMDRSGSMGATAPGSGVEKMQLANEGAARAIELLGDSDQVSVFAVDSTAHKVVPLSIVGPNKANLTHVVRRIEVAGGGIFVYTGMKECWKELQTAQVGQMHMILFADAADAEEPGDYIRLVEDMVKNKCSISVIGMGTESDTDAAFLKDIAARGQGRIFFDATAGDLPNLFAQETVAIARSAFITEPVGVQGDAGWLELSSTPVSWLPQVDGYNLSYLRPGATQAARSTDEYAAPLVAFWQRGAGRVAAISCPLGGDFSAKARAWPQYADLAQSLARWLMGEETPPGIGIRVSLDGTRLGADLFYDESWSERIAASPPRLLLAQGSAGAGADAPWERLAPGHFRAAIDLKGDAWVRGAVRVGDTALPFGPINAATNPEWSFDKARLDELATLATRSGGSERVDLSDVWRAERPPSWRDLTLWLLIALLLLLIVEAWRTRVARS